LEAESVLFRIRLLAHSAKNLFGIPANRSKARRWVLLGQLNYAHRGLDGGESAPLPPPVTTADRPDFFDANDIAGSSLP
jgi:hypothetical protein